MRILHTSDWHLGHRLHRRSRAREHALFLDWLAQLLEDQSVDVLLIAGDVFDTANPPARALELWYSFLATCAARLPDLEVVVVGGNHDSAARLDAPAELLAALRVRVLGGARNNGLARSAKEMVLRIDPKNPSDPPLWVAAVPFLRPVDLPSIEATEDMDPLIEGVRAYYQEVFDCMQAQADEKDPKIAMGHLYLRKGQLSELSERKVLGGNQHALPADVFPQWLDYVALGHLHRAQSVGSERIQYSGSPIPLAMDERHYRHQVCLLSMTEAGAPLNIESLRVPRFVPLARVPDKGSAALDEVLSTLDEILSKAPFLRPPDSELGDLDHPTSFLEACVQLTEPDPELRAKLEQACEAKGHQLSSLVVEYAGLKTALGDQVERQELGQLAPQQVLCAMHEAKFGTEPASSMLTAFGELFEELDVEREQA